MVSGTYAPVALIALALVALVGVTGCAKASSNPYISDAAADSNLVFPDGQGADGQGADGQGVDGSAPDACVPLCKGKACGASDGCGGTCQQGSCPAGKVCVAGVCKICNRWLASLPGRLQAVEVASDGTIYAGGAKGDQAFFAALDHCGGVKKSVTHLPTGAKKVSVAGLALSGSDLHAAGSMVEKTGDPQDGMWARLSTPDLTVKWMSKLTGSTGKDEVWDIASAGGALWMSGSADFDATSKVWGIKGVGTKACGFAWLGEGQGNGRRILADPKGSWVYFTGGQGGKGFVGRQSATACVVSPCGTCKAPWSVTVQDGTNSTEARALYLAGNDLYVGGFASASGDYRGVVFRVDLTTGKTLDSFTFNPSSNLDLPLALASDGKALFVAGSQNYTSPVTASVRAVLIKLTMPDLKQVWSKTTDPGGYWDVELVGSNGLVLAGATPTGGMIRRCLTDGTGC
jgi:hypothetical protein